MNVFIDTPQWSSLHDSSARRAVPGRGDDLVAADASRTSDLGGQPRRKARHMQNQPIRGVTHGGRPSSKMRGIFPAPTFRAEDRGPGTSAVDSYYEERAYARRRERRSRMWRVLRAALIVAAVPVAVSAVFFASYALTLIANGATPEQLAQAMRELALGCRDGLGRVALELKAWIASLR